MTLNESYTPLITKINSFLESLTTQVNDPETFNNRPTRSQIIKSVRSLSHEITKIALLLQDLRAKEEFFSNINECLDNLFSIFQGLSSHSCKTLFKSTQIYFKKLLKSLLEIFLEYQRQEESLGEDEENVISKQTTGLAWKCCEEFESLPINNSVALYIRAKELSSLVKDALDELSTIEKSIQRATGDLGNIRDSKDKETTQEKIDEFEQIDSDDEEFQDDDDDDYFDDDSIDIVNHISKEDCDQILHIVSVVRESYKSCKLFIQMMKSIQPTNLDDTTNDSPDAAIIYESILYKIDELSKNIDDIASAISPPLNSTYLSSQISIINVFSFEILQDIKTHYKLLNFPNSFMNPLDQLLNNFKK